MTQAEDIYMTLYAGDAASAEALARAALEVNLDDPDLMLVLGMSQHTQRNYSAAADTFRRLTELHPERMSSWGNYATELRNLGRPAEAVDAYRKALQIEPDNAKQWFNLGTLQLQERDVFAARDSLLKAHALNPNLPLIQIAAARALCECQDYRAADMLAAWRDWLPLPDDQQYNLADLMQLTDWTREAVEVLEDLLQRSADHIPSRLLLAALYERTNRLDAARTMLAGLAASDSGVNAAQGADVIHQQAALLARDKQFAPARVALEQAGPRNESDYNHYFQLGNSCDRLGDADAAMQAFATAHHRQIEGLRQTAPQRIAPGVFPLPAAEHSVAAGDYARWPTLVAPDARQSPVFVVGFPRSGTTLVEQMLDAHPQLQSMDERAFFYMLSEQLSEQGFRVPQDLGKLGQPGCDELRTGYWSLVKARVELRAGAQLVDKNPLNMLWLPMIHRMFPDARFILVQRHPCDVLLSNYMQEYRSAVLAALSTNLEQLAKGYVIALQHWMQHVAVFKPNVLTVRYEDLVADTAAQVARVGDFLGLRDASALLNYDQHAREKGFISTPSYTQVTEPISTRRVGHWHAYRGYFDAALPILQPLLTSLGYRSDDAAAGA